MTIGSGCAGTTCGRCARRWRRIFACAPTLPLTEFVANLARQRPEAATLAEPLARLESGAPSRAEQLRLMRRIEAEIAQLLGRQTRPEPESPVRQHSQDAEELPAARRG